MSISKTNEQAFEELIEKSLVGMTVEERHGNVYVDSQQPDDSHFYWGKPKDMDSKLAIDLRRLWSFLKTTQVDALEELKGLSLDDIPKQIAKQIDAFGVVDVLRNGVKINNIHLTLFYPKPSAADSDLSKVQYGKNQFSVTRQQTFSLWNPGLGIDMVVFVNGIPLFTLELKNPWTHQTAHYDGERQYKSKERSPKDPLLKFGHCLAHFTVDKNEAYFTTKLALDKTYFMPFNQGIPDGQGGGNPSQPDMGYRTKYLWDNVLQKDSIADIIMNYALFDYGEAKTQKKVPHIMKNAKKLIFPRFHQLDAVNRLIADVAANGVGKKYLIEHSAGSGKSNSLTWLAYKMIKVCPDFMKASRAKALDRPLFNSAIVVTDRRILDKQITDNIRAFGQSDQIIAHADSSKDLKEAIEQNKRIIITTIQKFPFICDSIADVSDHNFAIIIDEAHSSQTGIAADKMNATVQKDKDQDGSDTDELIEKLMKDRKMSSNCSYFAFTATPKKETLERFGVKDEEGKYHPFHLYSMKQAIEEGFILDVLTNYTTYRSYYELVKSIKDNPLFDNEKAQKLLHRAVESEPKTIRTKAEIMLEHFDAKIFRSHKLHGKAKAMVVTKDIECAIRYYQALQKIKQAKRLPFNILIAFSGEKTVDGVTYTEEGLNGFSDAHTAEEFDKDENRLLVVANKYITGFDQPKLCAMYIDKPLADVLAVQCLSRLNRSAPDLGKRSEDLFVLDFYNTKESMKEAFDQFYTSTTLSQATDVNVLHELRTTLLSVGVFDEQDINPFMDMYIHGLDADKWAPIIDKCADRFNKEIEWPENGKADFKMKCKQFVKIYSRVAAIIEFDVPDWEKLFWFLRFLIPELIVPGLKGDDIKDLLDMVDLNTYGLRRIALNEKIDLDSSETTVDPNKSSMVSAGDDDQNKDPLDIILKQFNEKWFKGWEATPDDQKAKLINIAKAVHNDSDYQNLVVGNPDTQAVNKAMDAIIDRTIRRQRKGDRSLYKEYQQNESFRFNFRNLIEKMVGNQEYI